LVGWLPEFPTARDWGCRNCDAAFFKNTQENLDALNGGRFWTQVLKEYLSLSQRSKKSFLMQMELRQKKKMN